MKIKTKLFLIFFVFTFFLAAAVSYLFYRDISKTKFEEIKNNAVSIASSASLIVDERKHSELLYPDDMKSKYYLGIRDRLRSFQKCFPQVRYIYTMVKTDKPNVWKFIVDATEPRDENVDGVINELEGTTTLAEEYDVSRYPEMQKAFEAPIADRGLYWDKWGCWLSAYAPVHDSKGFPAAIIGLDVSAKTIQDEKDKLKRKIFFIFCFAVIISFVMSAVLSNSVTRPVQKIISAVKLISCGRYEAEIGERRSDELGGLITSTNMMSKNIKKTIDKLIMLGRISETLNLTLDLEEALKISMNLSLEVLDASRGLILLYDRTKNALLLGASAGIKTAKAVEDELFVGAGKFSLKPDVEFLDYIVKNPDIYEISEMEKDSRLSLPLEWLGKTGTKLFSPLLVKQELTGFILLDAEVCADPDCDAGSKDKEFLKTFINQISMSLQNARLYREAVVDGLTGLFVHRYMEIQLSDEIRKSQRCNKKFSFLMIDIDRFKNFNDSYGHQTGDFVLRDISKLIKLLTRTVDVVSRYGGEEIAVIIPDTGIDGAVAAAEKIRSRIEERRFSCQDKILKVTVSIGVAEWTNEDPIAAGTLIAWADDALYKAKNEGRNRVCAFV